MRKTPVSKNKALQIGPLESVFPGSTSKILDFLSTFKDWDYSVSDIAKNSGVSFKTALNEIKNLEQQEVVSRTRTVGKAIMYKLNLGSKQGFHIDKLVFEIGKKRALESAEIRKKTSKIAAK
ncbi:MAG: helix-turn-helix domain-containing protein [Nitrosotalea sp.]